ncbi:glycogen synthase [Alloiococcus sp. CFN-8]|uniref:glycogen synthase n=1 Tax=Alloiococcus sp. CFN-8 TaxID=3416081 RepID=UPI003CF931CE
MNILYAVAEAYPFVHTGGLGEVAYALPKALREMGEDIRVILPFYNFKDESIRRRKKLADYETYIGWRKVPCTLSILELEGMTYYFIENPYYFHREGPYGYYDDGERFIYFSKAVLEGIKYLKDFVPDILHCNDWHTALMISLKDAYYGGVEPYSSIKTLYTIHNMLFQGNYGREVMDMLGLPEEKYYTEDFFKHHGGISFMKGALVSADIINTVSKSYSKEITKAYYAYGLEEIIKKRKKDVYGILNGIDYEDYNPEKNDELYFNYSEGDLEGKVQNKLRLQQELGLEIGEDIPLIAIISRLSSQKGIDLIEELMPDFMKERLQLIVVGGGSESYESMFKYYSSKYPEKVAVRFPFNRSFSKKAYASSDMLLMPSQFEACGIGQLIAMRYGTVPIVRKVGGLKDTVKSYNPYRNTGNGFVFTEYNSQELFHEIKRALRYYKDRELWKKIISKNMQLNHTWEASAKEYINLYKILLKKSK